ncbi:phosphoribosyltransferase family protein [Helicobacter sp. 11S02629-2]|uniref:phosphoribosyltransferase n=1 Tax=Helicobacter sp. 11S02629-2 TaxID=1476195 RepID=UPI000BA5D475|nr:phosphoribosyltransferase family protein [Helicobacter sp. 11S02629-2]PAF45657.1 nicotinate phosphoribosyltransferase [Helicobacter sp. 11S02629-2]
MYFYSYEEFNKDMLELARKIKNECDIDCILAIARGGVTIGHFLSIALNLRSLYTLNSIHYDDTQKLDYIKIWNIPDLSAAKNVLLVDDIVDSGDSMKAIKEKVLSTAPHINISTVSIFFKPNAHFSPDFSLHEAKEWIRFFWDIELKE